MSSNPTSKTVTEIAWRIVNHSRETCAAANCVLVHRQLIGELREALQSPVETSAPRALAFGDEVTYAPLYDSKLPREGWKVEVLPKVTYVIKHPNGSLIAVDAGEINAVEPIAAPGATPAGEASIPSEASRPRELLASKIESIRREVVALKRSIDPHISDPRRCEILRSDLDPIWQRLVALLDAEETSTSRDARRYAVISRCVAPKDLYDRLVRDGKSPGEWVDLPREQSIQQKIDELCDAALQRLPEEPPPVIGVDHASGPLPEGLHR